MHLPILHQDPDIIVVDKPTGVPTHAADPGDPYPADALRIVKSQTGLAYLGMHQRLDADTSGVLLFSARPEANRALAAAFEGRHVRKVYLALVWGAPPQAEGIIDAPLARDRAGRYRVTAATDPRKMTAVTRYRVLGSVRSDGFSRPVGATAKAVTTNRAVTLLEIVPETGRPHQIRVHLAHIGCPVVGDALYGPADRFPRLCLHAWQLALPHPATGEVVTFTAPPPALFEALSAARNRGSLAPALRFGASAGVSRSVTLGDKSLAPEGDASSFGHKDASLVSRRGASRLKDPLSVTVPDILPGADLSEIKTLLAAPSAHVRALAASDPAALRALLRLAAARRAPLAADPATPIYRVVNAAADGLPGLTVDRYGAALVASLYDDDAQLPPRPIPPALTEAIVEVMAPRAVYVKYRPQQASRIADDQRPLLAPPQPVYGPDLGELVAHEDGLAYLIRPGEGLSAGLFPDMREGRGRVRVWAAGRTVLNTFAYTCGFGVAALAGGATRVLNLDLSKAALAWGQENGRANGFAADPHDFVFGDVFDWLARLAKRGERFDLVILDPPGFSRTRRGTFSAAQDYAALAELAGRVLAPDGRLLACCNVAEIPWRSFRERVLAGLAAAGRGATVQGVYHEPALDFPSPPGQEPYLKMACLQL